jgi:hypothetical protein
MKTKHITKHPDFNCWQVGLDNTFYYLLGGRDGLSEPERITLPYYVKLHYTPSLHRWLNMNCEGWYEGGRLGYWFEKDTDAFQALMRRTRLIGLESDRRKAQNLSMRSHKWKRWQRHC